jgi:hypothetical protein
MSFQMAHLHSIATPAAAPVSDNVIDLRSYRATERMRVREVLTGLDPIENRIERMRIGATINDIQAHLTESAASPEPPAAREPDPPSRIVVADKDDALKNGIASLEQLIAAQARRLSALRALERAAKGRQTTGAALEIPKVRSIWSTGLAVLSNAFDSYGLTDAMTEDGELAREAEKHLGLVSGDWVMLDDGDCLDTESLKVAIEEGTVIAA